MDTAILRNIPASNPNTRDSKRLTLLRLFDELLLVIRLARHFAMGRPMLSEHPAYPLLGPATRATGD